MQSERSSDLIHKNFNLADLKALCDQLRVDYEDLPGGEMRAAKARALFQYLLSRGRLLELFEAVDRERPHINLSPYFHELIAERFGGEAAMQKLFDALGLPVRHFQEPEKHPWGSAVWSSDKAQKLQTYFYNRGEWVRLRQIVASESVRTRLPLDLATLERLFPAAAVPESSTKGGDDAGAVEAPPFEWLGDGRRRAVLVAEFETFMREGKAGQTGNITIHGNVGAGAAIGHGTSVEAKNIAGRDIHDSGDTPIFTWSGDIDFSPPSADDTRAGAKRSWFIRLRVVNNGPVAAKNCCGRLLRVTDEQGYHLKWFDPLNLYWARQDTPATYAPMDIRENGDSQYLDVAQVIEAENVMALRAVIPDGHRLAIPSGYTHRPNVLLPGTYYMQIAIYADNGSIDPTWLKIKWNVDYSEPYPCSIAFGIPPDNNK